MEKNLAKFIFKALLVSFCIPLVLPLSLIAIQVLFGSVELYLGSCSNFWTCFYDPWVFLMVIPKTWKLAVLLWGLGVLLIGREAYRRFCR